nr:MAG TPA: hypothetical protein [Herelleviridae sp.]
MRTRKSPGVRTLRNALVPKPGIVVVRHMILFSLTYHPVFSILFSSIAVNIQSGGTCKTSLFFATMNTLRQSLQKCCCLARIVVVPEVHNFYDLRASRDKMRTTTTRIVGHIERVLAPMFLHLPDRVTFRVNGVHTVVVHNAVPACVARLKAVGCFVERTRHNLSRCMVNDHTPHMCPVAAGLCRLVPRRLNVLSHLERIFRCSSVRLFAHRSTLRAKSDSPPLSFSRPGIAFLR